MGITEPAKRKELVCPTAKSGRRISNGRIARAAVTEPRFHAYDDFQQSRGSFQGAKHFYEMVEAVAIQLAEKTAVLAKRRADNEPISELEIGANVLRRHSGTEQHRHMRVLFHPPQLGQVRRFSSARAGDDHAIDEEKLGLLDFVQNIQVARQSVRAMLFLHVAENFDLSTNSFRRRKSLPAQPSMSPAPPMCGEDVTFNAQKIEVGFTGDFQGGFICGFEHLNSDWTPKLFRTSRATCFMTSTARAGSGGFIYGKVMTVFENDRVDPCFRRTREDLKERAL